MWKKHLAKFNIIHGKKKKNFHKIRNRGNSVNLIKNIYKIPLGNITFNNERLNACPLRSGTKQDVYSH